MGAANQKKIRHERNDSATLWAMISWLSGSGAFGGALGMTKAEKLGSADFFLCVVFGLLLGLAVVVIVWSVGTRVSAMIFSRMRVSGTLPWKRVLPITYALLFTCFIASGFLGALLTRFLARNILR